MKTSRIFRQVKTWLLCLSLLTTLSCVHLLPRYKYQIDSIKDTRQFIVTKSDEHLICASQRMNIDESGDFIFSDERAENCDDVLKVTIFGYNLQDIAIIEGHIKTIVEQYNSF